MELKSKYMFNEFKSEDNRGTLLINKKRIFIKYNLGFNKIVFAFLLFLLIFLSESISINNVIILQFNNVGEQHVLSSYFNYTPSYVKLNNGYITLSNKKIKVNSINDKIYLIWNYEFNNTRLMFYGLNNISKIDLTNFDFEYIYDMNGMFQYCLNLINIIFPTYSTKNVNTMENLFYGCISLQSLDLTYFDTSKVSIMRNMFYNCSKLNKIIFKTFKNSETVNMYGIFFYCSNLKYIDLSQFYTPKVEIMWHMFHGASSLTTLNLSTFDTSHVTDMESIFDDCNSLISLDLSNFRTSKVYYMNRMFKNCTKLEYLDFHNINTNSIGTMSQMFYQCKSLKYLNLYLINKESSTSEMFSYSATNFIYCIYSTSSVPTTKSFLDNLNAVNNCSNICLYGRIYSNIEKKCCEDYIYNSICVSSCPKRTFCLGKECKDLNCQKYYSYSQNECIYTIPEGYFLNDTLLKTIDKCHSDCKTCNRAGDKNNSYCTSCINSKYIYLGNCYNPCPKGKYYDNKDSVYKCKCFEEKCLICTEESLHYNLCISCNENYYPKFNDTNNKKINSILNYIDCYKSIEAYYLENNSTFKKCYDSCKSCDKKGDKNNHNCLSCNTEYNFEIKYDNYKNCYKSCEHYYYFDKNNDYICLNNFSCPYEYKNLIRDKKQCIDNCSKDDEYQYQFRNECFKTCPNNTEISNKRNKFCEIICIKELPLEKTQNQECTNICSINDFYRKLCISNYQDEETNANLLLNLIKTELTNNNFNSDIINNNIIINEKWTSFTLINKQLSNNNNNINNDLNECINQLKEYYQISNNKNIIILKININKEGYENKEIYEVFGQLKGDKFEKINLNRCNNNDKFDNIKCNLYSIDSILKNLCISCEEDYHEKYNDTSNIYPFINCYNSIQGYFLDNDNYFKKCFSSCLSCEEKGNEENHNCTSFNEGYNYKMILESYINCYIECPFYHYLNYCTINNKCENEYNKLILDKKECVKNCSLDDEYKYEFQKQCFKQCPENTEISKNKEFYCEVICDEEKPFERVEYQECVESCDINEMQLKKCITKYISNNTSSEDKLNDKKMESIENSFTDENYNTSNLENGQNEVIKDEKFTITLTTTENQKANKDSNMTTIDLGPCEKLLKEHYKMKQEDILYMKQIEVYQEGMKIPKIEYDVYAKLNGSNLVKLNLAICQNEKVDVSIKVEINDDLNKLNISSPYYNDICYIDDSNNGIDISLKDRKTDYVENNKAVCQENCIFTEYNYDNQKAKCSCSVFEIFF